MLTPVLALNLDVFQLRQMLWRQNDAAVSFRSKDVFQKEQTIHQNPILHAKSLLTELEVQRAEPKPNALSLEPVVVLDESVIAILITRRRRKWFCSFESFRQSEPPPNLDVRFEIDHHRSSTVRLGQVSLDELATEAAEHQSPDSAHAWKLPPGAETALTNCAPYAGSATEIEDRRRDPRQSNEPFR